MSPNEITINCSFYIQNMNVASDTKCRPDHKSYKYICCRLMRTRPTTCNMHDRVQLSAMFFCCCDTDMHYRLFIAILYLYDRILFYVIIATMHSVLFHI